MEKQDIINYIMETPMNTNPRILGQMLDEFGGGSVPSGIININTNGYHDVENYSRAYVDVPTSEPWNGTLKINYVTPTNQTYQYINIQYYDNTGHFLTQNIYPNKSFTIPTRTYDNDGTESYTTQFWVSSGVNYVEPVAPSSGQGYSQISIYPASAGGKSTISAVGRYIKDGEMNISPVPFSGEIT